MAGGQKSAKIQLTADLAQLKTKIAEAKKILGGIGDVKLDPKFQKQFQDIFSNDLNRAAGMLKDRVERINNLLGKMGQRSGKAFDTDRAQKLVSQLGQIKKQLGEINSLQGAGRGGGGGAGGMVAGLGRRLLAPIAAMAGVGASFSRAGGIAKQRQQLMGLTGGGQLGEGRGPNDMGFSQDERRQRAISMATAAGRTFKGPKQEQELRDMVSMGEKAERAFGVTGTQMAGGMSAGRHAGADPMKFASQAIGAATAAGMDSSKIGEWLQAISNSTSEMSEGVNLDTGSMRGVAGALAAILPANDPGRAFRALSGMDQAFKSGDKFQQAMATRAIMKSSPGSSAFGTELRRGVGLFGNVFEGEKGQAMKDRLRTMKGGKRLAETMSVTGEQVVQNLFDETQARLGTKAVGVQAGFIQEQYNVDPATAIAIVTNKGKLGKDEMKKFRESQMDPTKVLNDTFKGSTRDIIKSLGQLGDLKDIIAQKVAGPLASIQSMMSSALGLDGTAPAPSGSEQITGALKQEGKSRSNILGRIRSMKRKGTYTPEAKARMEGILGNLGKGTEEMRHRNPLATATMQEGGAFAPAGAAGIPDIQAHTDAMNRNSVAVEKDILSRENSRKHFGGGPKGLVVNQPWPSPKVGMSGAI